MKRNALMLIGAGVLLLAGTAGAQEFQQVVSSPRRASETIQQTGTFDLKLNRTDGAITRVVRSRAPLQMINPDAPEEYGSGEDLVVPDPIAKEPVGAKGINLFGFRF